jgi:hypothetical protein
MRQFPISQEHIDINYGHLRNDHLMKYLLPCLADQRIYEIDIVFKQQIFQGHISVESNGDEGFEVLKVYQGGLAAIANTKTGKGLDASSLVQAIGHFEMARVECQKAVGLQDSALKEQGMGLFVHRATYSFCEGRGSLIESTFYNKHGICLMKHEMNGQNLVAIANTTHGLVSLNGGLIKDKEPFFYTRKISLT